MVNPPNTESELLQRAESIAGMSLAELAFTHQVPVPKDLRTAKGWTGILLEIVLGATAGTQSKPDFEKISVELKSIPLDLAGKPKETTYVCTLNLTATDEVNWKNSSVYQKLKRVLWVPYEADEEIPIPHRRIGTPILWSPNQQQEAILENDWEEVMELIVLGKVESVSAKMGTYLQIRPKAANSRVLRDAYGESGDKIKTLPRGFYLRTQLTQEILERHYIV